ncbi:UDP-N-acetylmuramoyl-tripeptide--D-alanyl-D-alanine ligase domain protein [Mycobacterium ulcerans str. Harvey]|uniref:UDP-N-acetylmuramoyl-tripeptide--D-alanyl-D-alanine ligase domain protein n=1 Tax=Mycobacterium ulcerans str. Harvey TaxID=1299332 RepID=A0ABN0QT35_MYCUL|nr:UDP-N-acetylmuramoyl-tripeptide--D-alanyl-D-alanine ligase domain protein [Mycobacterium ulcerans str. Harvey]
MVRVGRATATGAGWAGPGDVWAGPVSLDRLARPQFTMHAGDAAAQVRLGVYGDHQVSNALCAGAVASNAARACRRWRPHSPRRARVAAPDAGEHPAGRGDGDR